MQIFPLTRRPTCRADQSAQDGGNSTKVGKKIQDAGPERCSVSPPTPPSSRLSHPPPGKPSSLPPALPRPSRATAPPPAARTPGQVATSMYGQQPRGGRGVSWSRLQGRATLLPGASFARPSPREGRRSSGRGIHAFPCLKLQREVSSSLQTAGPPGWGLAGGRRSGGGAGLLHSNGGRSAARAAALLLEPVPPAP